MSKERVKILEELKELSDENYRQFHSSLCPENNNILGVSVPKLRNYAKEIIKFEDWKETYKNIGNEFYEEILLQGMIIGLSKIDIEEKLKYLEEFIPKIDNWAVCDITCAGLKFINKNEERVFEFLESYLKSDKEFYLRFAIVVLLDFYINDRYVKKVLEILDNIKYTNYYYVKMAIAWAISIIYIRYPDMILEYLKDENNKLDIDTYNKSIQKIIESNRVSKREKNKFRKMKKRIIK